MGLDLSHVEDSTVMRRKVRELLSELNALQQRRSTRERSVAATKLEEAAMWLEQDHGKLALEQSKFCGNA